MCYTWEIFFFSRISLLKIRGPYHTMIITVDLFFTDIWNYFSSPSRCENLFISFSFVNVLGILTFDSCKMCWLMPYVRDFKMSNVGFAHLITWVVCKLSFLAVNSKFRHTNCIGNKHINTPAFICSYLVLHHPTISCFSS